MKLVLRGTDRNLRGEKQKQKDIRQEERLKRESVDFLHPAHEDRLAPPVCLAGQKQQHVSSIQCRDLISWGPCLDQRPAHLAGVAPSATVAVGNAGEVKAPRGDGHALRAEDAANSSGGGGSDGGVLREGAEDGSGQGHHHGRGLDDDGGVLALPDTGLIAAAGQRGRAAGLAWHTRVTAGHVFGLAMYLLRERTEWRK